MINIDKIRKKTDKTEYVGARLSKDTKAWLERFCMGEGISVSSLIDALVEEFKRSKDIQDK